MVSAMLLRIHQSGNLAELDPVRKSLVEEGIACYKRLCCLTEKKDDWEGEV